MSTFQERLQAALAPAYTLERELLGGGMSHVYLATESALGRQVVVKVLPPELAAGVNRDRFRREIQLAAQLQHPHIVPLLAAGEHGDFLYYTMPYVTGESLRARLEQQGRFAIRDVVRILTDVVDALAYAHTHGVIHRDIKPGNVLTQRSHALVTDFGVAKALSAAMPLAGMTTSGLAIGTPAYMAPEQLAADPAADHRVDLYAVGLLGYELLTGEAPFTGASPAQTMAAQLTRDPEPLPLKRPDVPPQLAAIIARCLSKEPDLRPASAEALLEELETVPHEPFTPARSAAAPMFTAGRRNGLVAAGIAAALLLGAVALRERGHDRTAALTAADSAAIEGAAESVAVQAGSPTPAPVAAQVARESAATAVVARISRADSIAIANAVRREIARENAARPRAEPGIHADSFARLFRMRLVDSLTQVSRLMQERFQMLEPGKANVWVTAPGPAAASGVRQVVIIGESPDHVAGIRDVERAIMDTLRMALRNSGKYRARRLAEKPSAADDMEPEQLARSLGADIVFTLTVVPMRNDSLRAILVVDDPALVPQYARRVVSTQPMPMSAPLREVGEFASSALATLEQMSRRPRVVRVAPRGPDVPRPPEQGRNDGTTERR